MKLYRVSYRDQFAEHKGYEYFSNKKDALKADNTNKENSTRDDVEEIEINLSKKGVIFAFNQWASHPDNG
jgi:hypothetical protein